MTTTKLPQSPTIATDPDQARRAFEGIRQMAGANDPAAQWMLQCLIESVMIDHITNAMVADDVYALMIGRRVQMLVKAVLDRQTRERVEHGIRKADTA